MAKQRYVNTKFWSDNFISELNPLDRYLFLYFLTNEHTNICGIYEVPLKTMAFETGIEIDMLKKMIKRLIGKVYYIDGWIYLKNFAKHQAVNESIKKGIEVSKSTVPAQILLKIQDIDQDLHSLGTASPQDPTYLNFNFNTNLNSNSNIKGAEPSSADIPIIIKSFETINPACKKMYGNTTQRKACQFLIDTYSLERVKSVIEETLPRTNKIAFFPSITTPLQLQEKWSALESAINKHKNKSITEKEKSGNVYW